MGIITKKKIKEMNKNKSTELDVDFIGGQGSLTKVEEQGISEFIKAKKLLMVKRQSRNKKDSLRLSTRKKIIAK